MIDTAGTVDGVFVLLQREDKKHWMIMRSMYDPEKLSHIVENIEKRFGRNMISYLRIKISPEEYQLLSLIIQPYAEEI